MQSSSDISRSKPDRSGHRADQELKPILRTPTPSFSEIADRPGTRVESLRRFLATTHWDMKTVPVQMPEPLLTPEQAASVSRYILSLCAR